MCTADFCSIHGENLCSFVLLIMSEDSIALLIPQYIASNSFRTVNYQKYLHILQQK